MLYKGLPSEIYNTIFYTVHKKYVTNKYGHAKIESSHLNTEIWTMTCDWETLLKKRKKCKAFTYWTGNPQISGKEKGSTDVKQIEFLLIKQRNKFAKYFLSLYGFNAHQ